MVDGQWILLGYLLLLVVTVVALLCGDWPIFEGTPIQSFHHCITGGAFAYFEKVVEFLCGERGRRSLSSLEHYCCERPNPILQLFYISIIGGIYYAIVQSSFEYIPGYFVPSIHRYIGTFAVGIGIILFLMTSFSDPGTVTAENVSFQLSAYAYDGVLYEEKVCSTCNLPRPARSKHCGICGRCVARFDHHCAWMNNCIGWNNLRYFLAFLLWHCLLCIYGASVLVAILAGQVKEQNIVRILTVYFGVANTFDKLMPHIFQWLLGYYNTQVFIILFLLVISLLLIGFLGYHVYLVATNTTTNESYKWENYRRWKLAEAARESELDEQRSGDAGGQLQKKRSFLPKCGGVFRLFRSQEQTQPALSRDNIYNRGFVNNAYEILFPRRNQGRSNPKEKKKRP